MSERGSEILRHKKLQAGKTSVAFSRRTSPPFNIVKEEALTLKNFTTTALKSCTSLSVASAAVFMLATPAESGSIKNGNATDLTVYGQVNRTFMVYDDGEETGYRNMDGDAGSTRFGLKATGKINESVSVGARLEAELQSNDPATISQSTESDSTSGFTERLAFINALPSFMSITNNSAN